VSRDAGANGRRTIALSAVSRLGTVDGGEQPKKWPRAVVFDKLGPIWSWRR